MTSVSFQYLGITQRLKIGRAPDRLANQRRRDVAFQQALKCIDLVKVWIQPHVKVFRPEHQRDALRVDVAESRVRRQGDHSKGINEVIPELPALPESGKGRGFTLGVNVVHLLSLAFTKRPPFVEGADRDNATAARVSLLPKWTGRQSIRPGIESVELGVRPVSVTVRLLLDQQRPDAIDQLAPVAVVEDKFRRTTRRNVKLWARPQRHAQLVHQLTDHGTVSHIESATHSGSPFATGESIAEGFWS